MGRRRALISPWVSFLSKEHPLMGSLGHDHGSWDRIEAERRELT